MDNIQFKPRIIVQDPEVENKYLVLQDDGSHGQVKVYLATRENNHMQCTDLRFRGKLSKGANTNG